MSFKSLEKYQQGACQELSEVMTDSTDQKKK